MNHENVPTEQVRVWPEYQDEVVGLQVDGLPPTTIPPDEARELADDVAEEHPGAMTDVSKEVAKFVKDLRRIADDVDPDADIHDTPTT